jgi:hypothetical protein
LLKNINKFFAGAFFNTEYTDGKEPKRYTEFLKEHGNTQKLTPIFIQLKASPRPSKRGDVLPRGFFFDSKIQLSLIPLTILSHPTSSFHAPLHSERGRGRGCRLVGGEAVDGRGRG